MAVRGSITFIYAQDFESECEFYGKRLGLPAAGHQSGDVQFYALPGAYLAIVREGVSAAASPPVSARTAGRDTIIVGLLCTNAAEVDALVERLDPSCIIAPPPRNDQFGIYNAMARDPAGYLVEIQCFTGAAFVESLQSARRSKFQLSPL